METKKIKIYFNEVLKEKEFIEIEVIEIQEGILLMSGIEKMIDDIVKTKIGVFYLQNKIKNNEQIKKILKNVFNIFKL